MKQVRATSSASVGSYRIMALLQALFTGQTGVPTGGACTEWGPSWGNMVASGAKCDLVVQRACALFYEYLACWHTVPCTAAQARSERALVSTSAAVLVDSVARIVPGDSPGAMAQVLTGVSPTLELAKPFGLPFTAVIEASASWTLASPALV